MEKIAEIGGASFSIMGMLWVIFNNRLPHNCYSTLLTWLCYTWVFQSSCIIVFNLIIVNLPNVRCSTFWSLFYNDCPLYIDIFRTITESLAIFTYLMTFVLCRIPWALITNKSTMESIKPKRIVLILIPISLIRWLEFIPNSTVFAVSQMVVFVITIASYIGMIYYCSRTWFRLRKESHDRQAQYTIGSFQYREITKHKASKIMLKLSGILLLSNLMTFIALCIFLVVTVVMFGNGGDPQALIESGRNSVVFQILLILSFFIGNLYGGIFAIGFYCMFDDIRLYNIPHIEGPVREKKVVDSVIVADDNNSPLN
ncbi:hypothetical protein BC833DRAFT_611909 [Globomyces pollinis-pini]|nr:hypothetical protein BC833DRAFT_611909 [Globomyces pollinis-pini]